MTHKHTPAPWKVHKVEWQGNYNKYLDVGPDLRTVVSVLGKFEAEDVGEEARANAHLIAAAPELLEALENTLWLLEKTLDDPSRLNDQVAYINAKAVISKAGGK